MASGPPRRPRAAYPYGIAADDPILRANEELQAAEANVVTASAKLAQARDALIDACTADNWTAVFRNGSRCVMERDGLALEIEQIVARAQRAAA